MTRDEPLDRVADRLDEIRRVQLLSDAMIAEISPVDERSLQAGLQVANEAGLWKPSKGSS